MTLRVSYWTGYDPITRQCYGTNISCVDVTLTGSSASLGTVPANATVARLKAGEGCRISNNTAAASSTNGTFLDTGDVCDLAVNHLAGTTNFFGMTSA